MTAWLAHCQARQGMAGVLHSMSLYMLPCSGISVSGNGGIINDSVVYRSCDTIII